MNGVINHAFTKMSDLEVIGLIAEAPVSLVETGKSKECHQSSRIEAIVDLPSVVVSNQSSLP